MDGWCIFSICNHHEVTVTIWFSSPQLTASHRTSGLNTNQWLEHKRMCKINCRERSKNRFHSCGKVWFELDGYKMKRKLLLKHGLSPQPPSHPPWFHLYASPQSIKAPSYATVPLWASSSFPLWNNFHTLRLLRNVNEAEAGAVFTLPVSHHTLLWCGRPVTCEHIHTPMRAQLHAVTKYGCYSMSNMYSLSQSK